MRFEGVPEWLTNTPLLIYGPRKSGTTLLQNLHDGSEQLFVYPAELKLKFLVDILLPDNLNDALLKYAEFNRIEETPHLNYAGYRESILVPQFSGITGLRELILNDIFSLYKNIDNASKKIKFWAIKEVGGDTDAIVRLWRQMFLDGKIVMIVRNPLMVIRSVLRDRRRRSIKLSFKDIYRQVQAAYTTQSNQMRYVEDPSICFVSYERLTSETEKTMRYICGYLGIDFAPVMATPTIFRESVIVRTSSHETKRVFYEKSKWNSGLTVRELLFVLISLAILWSKHLFLRGERKLRFYQWSKLLNEIDLLKEVSG